MGSSPLWSQVVTLISYNATRTKQYVAVKILTAGQSEGNLQGNFGELPILQKIVSANHLHPGYQHITLLKNHFTLDNSGNVHEVFATEILGSTVLSLRRKQPHKVFSVATTKRITKQILRGLDYLHTECNVIHTDLKADNIMVAVHARDDEIERLLIHHPSETYPPRIFPFPTPEHTITAKSQPLPNFGLKDDMSNIKVKIGDFGHSTWKDKHYTDEIQPVGLRAPEVVLGYPWSTPVDIWTVGCLVVELLTGRDMWNPKPGPSWSAEDDHLAKMLRVTKGTFPEAMISRSKRGSKFFDPKHPGKLRAFSELGPLSMIEYLQKWSKANMEELEKSWTFISKCYTLDPAKRPTAAELLGDEWLKDVE
ncbi:hypothetical protein FRB90_010615 [Tulasnella sp. 427]|nr:hypothetical protein FRB90_010615 [Tulasnella sp. 427]